MTHSQSWWWWWPAAGGLALSLGLVEARLQTAYYRDLAREPPLPGPAVYTGNLGHTNLGFSADNLSGDMTWHDMAWHDVTWPDMTWHDIMTVTWYMPPWAVYGSKPGLSSASGLYMTPAPHIEEDRWTLPPCAGSEALLFLFASGAQLSGWISWNQVNNSKNGAKMS